MRRVCTVAAEGELNVLEYRWPHPGETAPSPKVFYPVNAGRQICGAGCYK